MKIRELSLISPFFSKGTLDSILNPTDLLFKINENTLVFASDLVLRYGAIFREAISIHNSGFGYFLYPEYEKRILMNYAIAFIKRDINVR